MMESRILGPAFMSARASPIRWPRLPCCQTSNQVKESHGAWIISKVDGEAEYGISATLHDPPDDRKDYESDLAAAQDAVDNAESDDDREAAESALEELVENDPGIWSEFNGAWMICEVFRVDEPNTRAPVYDSLAKAFAADLIDLAREV